MNARKTIERLIALQAEAAAEPHAWIHDRIRVTEYANLLRLVQGRHVVMKGNFAPLEIRDVGFHPDGNGLFDPEVCEGYVIAPKGYLHLRAIDWRATQARPEWNSAPEPNHD